LTPASGVDCCWSWNSWGSFQFGRAYNPSCGWLSKPVMSGLKYANSLWWGGRVQSNEPMTNTMSNLWCEVGTPWTDVHPEKSRVYSNPSPHHFLPIPNPLARLRLIAYLVRGFFIDFSQKTTYDNIMKTIKDILSQFGYIDSNQIKELVEHFPHTQVVIQWGGLPRESIAAHLCADRIKHVEDRDIDYVRSVFLRSETVKKLKEVFAIAE